MDDLKFIEKQGDETLICKLFIKKYLLIKRSILIEKQDRYLNMTKIIRDIYIFRNKNKKK